jgi:CxxC-x17-CxxC domain-containing protein
VRINRDFSRRAPTNPRIEVTDLDEGRTPDPLQAKILPRGSNLHRVTGESGMEFIDRLLICADCGGEFIFTAGEQLFFFDKQFKNDPKRCKPCKCKRAGASALKSGTGPAAAGLSRTETRTECSDCGIETTVPFKPTQGRPVLCRQCFQKKRVPTTGALVTAAATAEMVAAGSMTDRADMASEPALA